jgi:quinol monooxygenase YgiN
MEMRGRTAGRGQDVWPYADIRLERTVRRRLFGGHPLTEAVAGADGHFGMSRSERQSMSGFEVSARMIVRDGELEGFKQQAAECIRVTREKDTRTLRYDWFLSDDGTECEIREAYVDADGFLEHRVNVGDALNKLFSEFADAHNVMVYGEASPKLVEFANANMPPGSVLWYGFLQGLKSVPNPTKGLEVSVRMKVRDGALPGLKAQATKCIEQTWERDTKTLRYDWFLSDDGTSCEIREAYVDSQGVIEHRMENVRDATNELFGKFADDPVVTVYGDASPELIEFGNMRMGEAIRWFTFLGGLDS